MTTLGTAYIQVLPSTKGISPALQSSVGAAGASAGEKGGALIGSGMAKAIGVAAIGSAIKKSVEEGAKLEQSLGGVETLYKQHAGVVIKNANRAYKTAGLSANDYMEQSTMFAASLLQSLDGDTSKAAKYADMAILDMSDNANKFGTNISDIQNAYQGFSKQNYTMLDNLKLGYGGTQTEMKRLLADASKISGQKYDISNLSDVYDAIHVVQKEMGVTGTTSKEAASTLSGSFASMKSAATNFLGNLAIGKNVSKSLGELISSASTFLFKNLIPALVNVAKALPGAIMTAIRQGIPALITQLPGLINTIINTAVANLNKAANFMDSFFNNIGNNPKAMRSGIKIVGKIALGLIKGAAKLAVASVKLMAKLIVNLIRYGPKLVAAGVKLVGSLVKGLGGSAFAKIKQVAIKLVSKFTEPIQKIKTKIKNIIDAVRGIFPIRLGKIFDGITLPHFKVSGGKLPWGIGGKGKAPSIDVQWYAKGGIVNDATLIGAGEAGAEAIVPLTPFWNKMDSIANAIQTSESQSASAGVLNVIFKVGEEVIGQSAVNYINGQTIQFGTSPINV